MITDDQNTPPALAVPGSPAGGRDGSQCRSAARPHAAPTESGFGTQRGFKLLRLIVVIALTLSGLRMLHACVTVLSTPNVFRKDFVQDYLMAKATLAGVDPYVPVADLAERFLPPLPSAVWPHPSPHPPPALILVLPLALFDYRTAATVWFLGELACLAFAAWSLLFWWEGRNPRLSAVAVFWVVLVAWTPIAEELLFGQFSLLILALLARSWLDLGRGRWTVGGLLVGTAVALKLFAWPIVLLGVLTRKWRFFFSAVVAFLAAKAGAAFILGFDRIVHYYQAVGPSVAHLWRAYDGNASLWSIGWRLFEGTGSTIAVGVVAPPLVDVPAAAPYVSGLVVISIVVFGLRLAVRKEHLDLSLSILVCVSVLVSPVVWSCYLAVVLIPLAVAAKYTTTGTSRSSLYLLAVIVLVIQLPFPLFRQWMALLGETQANGSLVVSAPLALVTLARAAALLALIWMLGRFETSGRRSLRPAASGAPGGARP